MNLELEERVVLVTGGAAGIGGATSLSLAAEGAIPVVLDRNPMAAELERRLVALQPEARCFQLDLRRASHVTGQWIVVDGGYTHLDRALT